MTCTRAWSSALLLVALCAACSSGGGGKNAAPDTTPDSETTVATTKTLVLTSTAFGDDGTIPTQFTCNGKGAIPPLAWTGVPVGTTSLALIVHDPDAPVAGGFTHWVLTGLPAADGHLPPVPAGAQQIVPWRPPCPPKGSAPHHYRFTLYALHGPATTQAAIPRAAIAQVTLVGTYGR